MTFSGIPFAALDFYEELESDNSKVFWTAKKQVYEVAVRVPVQALAVALEPEFGPGKLFRPYRDVRFSADKTPYKTSQGAWFEDSGMYLQVSAAGLFVGGGRWRSSPEQVGRLRQAVDDDRHGPVLAETLLTLTKAGFAVGGEQLTRVPAGYPKDHLRADLLRYKTLTAHFDLGAPAWLTTAETKDRVAAAWRQIGPLVQWLRDYSG